MCDKEGCLCKSCRRYPDSDGLCASCHDTWLFMFECSKGGIKECSNYINKNSLFSRIINYIADGLRRE